MNTDFPYLNDLKTFQDTLEKKRITPQAVTRFSDLIWNYYKQNKRIFEWRQNITPYTIVVSEIMLQQTQTSRVNYKYKEFIKAFPDLKSLAQASQADVLLKWQGLGYNRRGMYLHGIAKTIMNDYNGILPDSPKTLETFSGLGPATAASIVTFAYNKPTVFIETNIRSVFLHCFFYKQENVSDKQLFPLIQKTVCTKNPREWYYALMDYGVMLKKHFKNPNKKSKHYTKQSAFKGSNREVRSKILKALLKTPLTYKQLIDIIPNEEIRIEQNLLAMTKEGLLAVKEDTYHIKQ